MVIELIGSPANKMMLFFVVGIWSRLGWDFIRRVWMDIRTVAPDIRTSEGFISTSHALIRTT